MNLIWSVYLHVCMCRVMYPCKEPTVVRCLVRSDIFGWFSNESFVFHSTDIPPYY